MLKPGDCVQVSIEKPVAGGRMLARADGEVLFVLGAIPGERVNVRITRVSGGVAHGTAVEILEADAARRPVEGDPACGGMVFAHIAYERQLALKAAIVRDALERLARRPLERDVPVHGSPERDYRLRARFHVRRGRAGFLREGTHEICDAAPGGQVRARVAEGIAGLAASLDPAWAALVDAFEWTENIAGDECAVHVLLARGGRLSREWAERQRAAFGLRGLTAGAIDERPRVLAGAPHVGDPLAVLTSVEGPPGARIERQPRAFFQANRFLLPTLVRTVLASIPRELRLIDLYAGVGLFSMAAAFAGQREVDAVEGDAVSASDLARNARAFGAVVRPHYAAVESFLARANVRGSVLLVDPPRTGMSRAALASVLDAAPDRIVYVSCDVATFARDTGRLGQRGWRLSELRAFDLFPNTGHVEVAGTFER